MNKKKARLLLLSLLLLVAGNGYADQFETIYSHNFTKDGFGDYEICDIVKPDSMVVWTYVENKYVLASGSKEGEIESMLISPVVDLSDYIGIHIYTSFSKSNFLHWMYDVKLMAQEVGSDDWQDIDIEDNYSSNSTPSPAKEAYSFYCQNTKVRFAFYYKARKGTGNKFRLGELSVKGIRGYAAKDTAYVNSIHEVKEIEQYRPFSATLHNTKRPGGKVLRDSTGAIILEAIPYNLNVTTSDVFDAVLTGYKVNTGYLTIINDAKIEITSEIVSTGDGYNDYKEITADEYWENIGDFVRITDRGLTCWLSGNSSLDSVRINDLITVIGQALPTIDGNKGIDVGTRDMEDPSIIRYYSDEENNEIGDYFVCNLVQHVIVRRSLKGGCWNSVCVPCNASLSDDGVEVAEFVSCENGVITFKKLPWQSLTAGVPYLVRLTNDTDSIKGEIYFSDSSFSEFPQTISYGDYNFVGTYSPVQPADGSYYLSANNTIRPLASGGTIKGFRAYFEPNTPNAAQARAISIDGVVTAIEDFPLADDLFVPTGKVYTVSGQYVGDDLEVLPKGMYIVNGKKVIK